MVLKGERRKEFLESTKMTVRKPERHQVLDCMSYSRFGCSTAVSIVADLL
jgi:hypothetical protein